MVGPPLRGDAQILSFPPTCFTTRHKPQVGRGVEEGAGRGGPEGQGRGRPKGRGGGGSALNEVRVCQMVRKGNPGEVCKVMAWAPAQAVRCAR